MIEPGQARSPTPARAKDAKFDRPVWRWPLDGEPRVLRRFTPPPAPWLAGHRGIDLVAPPATPVLAAGAGTVRYAGSLAGRGVVSIDHSSGLRTTYLPVDASVLTGQRVAPGDRLGIIEDSPGHCQESCLHWGLLRPPRYLDPLLLLGQAHIRLLPFWDAPVREQHTLIPKPSPAALRPSPTALTTTDATPPAPPTSNARSPLRPAHLQPHAGVPASLPRSTFREPARAPARTLTPYREPTPAPARTPTAPAPAPASASASENAFPHSTPTSTSASEQPIAPASPLPTGSPIEQVHHFVPLATTTTPAIPALGVAAFLGNLLLITLLCLHRRTRKGRPSPARGQHRKASQRRSPPKRARPRSHRPA
ncbi:M23 family metallopeptidase [Nonomuraea cavernae]|uniref:M23 family metallopeptidase n=1 Tax=Nonomuraea cavernae TaxID=2045107 RepID=UPI0033EAFC51